MSWFTNIIAWVQVSKIYCSYLFCFAKNLNSACLKHNFLRSAEYISRNWPRNSQRSRYKHDLILNEPSINIQASSKQYGQRTYLKKSSWCRLDFLSTKLRVYALNVVELFLQEKKVRQSQLIASQFLWKSTWLLCMITSSLTLFRHNHRSGIQAIAVAFC